MTQPCSPGMLLEPERREDRQRIDLTTALGMKSVKNVKETLARKRNAGAPMLTVLDDMHVLLQFDDNSQ